MAYGPDMDIDEPVAGASQNVEYTTAAIVIGALAALVMISRGFRGINVGGVNVGVR